MDYGIVYKITNLVDGKIYIGQTTRTAKIRFNEHATRKTPIGYAIRKYGKENFKVEDIEKCSTFEMLNERERYWIAFFECMIPKGYNLTSGGDRVSELVLSEDLRKKRSESAKKMWAERSPEERSEMARKREAKKSFATRSKIARKAAATRNSNTEMHVILSEAHRGFSPFKNLISAIDEWRFSYALLARACW